jgi:hypothetical protein
VENVFIFGTSAVAFRYSTVLLSSDKKQINHFSNRAFKFILCLSLLMCLIFAFGTKKIGEFENGGSVDFSHIAPITGDHYYQLTEYFNRCDSLQNQ